MVLRQSVKKQGLTFQSPVLTKSKSHGNFFLCSSPGSGATIQGIIHGVYWGLGMAVGGVLGGVMVHVIGARLTFRIEAVFSFVILLLFFAINNFHEKSSRYSKIPSDDQDEEIRDDVKGAEECDSSMDSK